MKWGPLAERTYAWVTATMAGRGLGAIYRGARATQNFYSMLGRLIGQFRKYEVYAQVEEEDCRALA
eukprot:2116740-Pyramimonas_sp.AAC.1